MHHAKEQVMASIHGIPYELVQGVQGDPGLEMVSVCTMEVEPLGGAMGLPLEVMEKVQLVLVSW